MTTKELRLINEYVDKKNPKYELNGMFVDTKNGYIVSTNTRALCAYEIDTDDKIGANGIIPKEIINLSLKTATKKKEWECVINERDVGGYKVLEIEVRMYKGFDERHFPLFFGAEEIVGSFPNYHRIMFDKKSDDVVVVEADYMTISMEIAKAGIMLDEKLINPILNYLKETNQDKVEFLYRKTEEQTPIMINFGKFKTVLMPLDLKG